MRERGKRMWPGAAERAGTVPVGAPRGRPRSTRRVVSGIGVTLAAVGVALAAPGAPQAHAATGIALLDPPKVVATIPVRDSPIAVALNPSSGRVYVVNRDDDSVSVIDPGSNTVVATIPVLTDPESVAVNPVSGRVYVVDNSFSGTRDHSNVQVIDPASNTVTATITVPYSARHVAINPLTGRLYVTVVNYGDGPGHVVVIDPNSNAVTATIPVGSFPEGIAVHPVTGTVYVADEVDNTIKVINSATNQVTARPSRWATTRSGSR
jgi:YVTN family beta-propeller protein